MPLHDPSANPAGLALTRVNADSAWLIEVDGVRLLLDPWFGGTATLVHRRLHVLNLQDHRAVAISDLPRIDGIVISHPFPDHCHPTTLRQLSRDIPVYAPAAVRPWVRRLRHFREIHVIRNTTRGGTAADLRGVTLTWCRAEGLLDTTHNALVIRGQASGSTVVYAPHGLKAGSRTLAAVDAAVGGRVDMLLGSFTLVDLPGYLGGVANLGPELANGLVSHLRPRFVTRTHDGRKADTGFIARVMRIREPMNYASDLAALGVPTQVVEAPVGQTWRSVPGHAAEVSK